MPSHIVDYKLPVSNRTQMRIDLISCFLNEFSGTGRENNASRYQYNVETYGDYGIYLKRPTQLNKGFDFTVTVKDVYFKKNKRYSNPSHQDIFNALQYYMNTYCDEYDKVKKQLLKFIIVTILI